MGEGKTRKINKSKLSKLPAFWCKVKTDDAWPQNGDVFYWVRSDTGDICESKWNENSQSCKFREQIGNVFRSQVDARNAKMRQIERNLDAMEALK